MILKHNPNHNSAPATAKRQGPAYVDGIVWKFLKDNAVRYGSLLSRESDAITRLSAESWTVRRLFGEMGLGGRNAPIVGSGDEVADRTIAWVEETGVDGFDLSRVVTPDTFLGFVSLVVPILQDRGVFKHDSAHRALREELFGRPLLPEAHPAANLR